MAYLDLARRDEIIAPAPSFLSVPTPRGLDATERSAVLLARNDRNSSIRPAGALDRIGTIVFGFRRPNRLADPRLEALRRFAVATAREKRGSVDWERVELQTLGFSEFQIAQAAEIANRYRRPPAPSLWSHVAAAILLFVAFLGLRRELDDVRISAAVALLVILPFWAAIAPRPAGQRHARAILNGATRRHAAARG
jgi:hypothetical protein